MSYSINVSLNGSHFFATAKRSLDTKDQAFKVFTEIKNRFPKNEGFKITLDYTREIGRTTYNTDLYALTDTQIMETLESLSQ